MPLPPGRVRHQNQQNPKNLNLGRGKTKAATATRPQRLPPRRSGSAGSGVPALERFIPTAAEPLAFLLLKGRLGESSGVVP